MGKLFYLLLLVCVTFAVSEGHRRGGSGRGGRGGSDESRGRGPPAKGENRGNGWFNGWFWGQTRRCIPRRWGIPAEVPPVDVLPVSQIRTLVGTCTADVGACPVGACRYDPRRPSWCPADGFICPETERREVDCGFFGLVNVSFVTGCKCCKDEGIVIRGMVVDSSSGMPLEEATLSTGSDKTVTQRDGAFTFTVESRLTRVVIRAAREKYVSTVKIIDIPDNFRGPIEEVISMVAVADPVEIDANNENNLPIVGGGETRASILIPAGTFRRRGRRYTGKVLASVTFIDTADASVEAEIPGRLLTVSGDPLISDGMFALNYEAATGEPLSLGPVTVSVRDDMLLWTLTDDGVWAPVDQRRGRRKRQAALNDTILINIQSGTWINIDKIPGAPVCYFKARVYDQATGTEVISSATATFQPAAIAYTTLNQRLPFYLTSSNQPSSICHAVRCPNIDVPNNLLIGLISMKSYETVSVGSGSLPVIQTLTPRDLAGYSSISSTTASLMSAVQYEVIPAGDQVYINYISNVDGPFYTTQTSCLDSNDTAPSFHFLKPGLPSYVPYPNDTELCTARIGFFDNYMFIDALNNSASLPTVVVTSTWTVNGTSYYYTENATMELPAGDSNFTYLCVRYRCSDDDANTTVYLNILTPNVTVNYTGQDSFEVPAFNCWGNCSTGNCGRNKESNYSIDGSFVAPVNITGTGFFGDDASNCTQVAFSDPFAASYYCYGNRGQFEFPRGERGQAA